MCQDDNSMQAYFSGEKLYGDDFTPEQIAKWFEREKEAYADLGAKDSNNYRYLYHALNDYHGFRILPQKDNRRILGVGNAYGDELRPVLSSAREITILGPSEAFAQNNISGIPVNYVKPQSNGDLPFNNNSFDLITCFGVLHHIPNVTKVINEFYRCLSPCGNILLREPTISMGDWRKPRKGLTSAERGIPLKLLRQIILEANFIIMHEKKCVTPFPRRLQKWIKKPVYNSKLIVRIDSLLSSVFAWNDCYHPVKWFTKIRPMAVFYLLGK